MLTIKAKKFLVSFLLVISVVSVLNAQKLIQKTLDNGMQVVVKENHTNESVGMYCFVKSGSSDEEEYLGAGVSHYLEHIVSSGTTTKRTEKEYQELQKKIGAYSNAYTTYKTTCFIMQANKKFSKEALEMLSENMQFCVFDSSEIAREIDVIKKEFVMRTTPPRSQMYTASTKASFIEANYQHEVIGYIEQFSKIEREDLVNYYNKRYAPNNMVFVAVGDFKAEDMLTEIKEAFKDFKRKAVIPVYQPEEHVRPGNLKIIEEFEVEQSTGYITKIVEEGNYEDYIALDVASDILFGKRTSPVKYRLVEKEKLVNYIYGYYANGYESMQPEKMVRIGFETKDAKNLDKIVSIIDDEIKNVLKKGIEQNQIDEIITRTKARYTLSTPSIDEECDEIGWNMMSYGMADMKEEYLAGLERLTPKDVERVIKKYFDDNNRVIFFGVPNGEKDKLSSSEKEVVKTEFKKIVIDENITLIHKQTNASPIINGLIFLPISSDYETLETVGSFDFLTEMLFSGGSEDYSSIELANWIEDHAITFNANIDRFGITIKFKAIKEDYKEVMKRLEDILNNPLFEESEIKLAKDRWEASYKRSLSNPSEAHTNYKNNILYKGKKASKTFKDKNELIQKLTKENLEKMYEKYIKADKIIVTLYGDLTAEEAQDFANDIKDFIPGGSIDDIPTTLEVEEIEGLFNNEYGFEQCNVDINFKAPKQNEKDFYTVQVLNAVLSMGSAGRLHHITRGINNLAYFAYSFYSYTNDYGFFRIVSQTSKQNKDELIEVIKAEIVKIQNGDVSAEEIKLAVEGRANYFEGNFDDDRWAGRMTQNEAKGLGYNFTRDSTTDMLKVTPEMIKEAAIKYLSKMAIIISYPSDDVKRTVE